MPKINLLHLFSIFQLFLFGLFFGFKPLGKWVDEEGYFEYYEKAISTNYSNILTLSDSFFYFLLKLLSDFNLSFEWIFAIFSAISTVIIIMRGYFISKNIVFIIIYMSFIFWLHIYTQARMALALSLFLISIIYFKKNKLIYSFILLISIYTHLVIIACHILYIFNEVLPLIKKKWQRITMISFIVISVIILNNFIQIFSIERISIYNDLLELGIYAADSNKIKALTPLIILLSTLYILFKEEEIDKEKRFLLISSTISVSAFYFINSLPIISHRLYELFYFFSAIMIASYWRKYIFIRILGLAYITISIRNTFLLFFSN